MQRVLDRLRRLVVSKVEQEIDHQASAGGDGAALRPGHRIPGAEMGDHAGEHGAGKRRLRRAGLGVDGVEHIGPFREIRRQHFIDELGRAVLEDRSGLGKKGDLQLGRSRIGGDGRVSQQRGHEGQHQHARKGHMFL